jgi:peptidoglycan hydrolase-like protein with peptidoglycan-binding domain
VTIALALVAGAIAMPPAFANHAQPFDGPKHDFGDMVDYPLIFPVAGKNNYGDSFYAGRGSGVHHATDVMASKMTPVVAVASGTVVWTGSSCCTIQIRHNDGWKSKYIHLNNDSPGTDDGQGWGIAPGIKIGSKVKAGQLIGWVGDSGNAEGTAPHLHFELVDPDGVNVNPYRALRNAQGANLPAVCEGTDLGALGALVNGSGLLKRGAVGQQVRQLQRFLNAIGHGVGTVDGVFGSRTAGGLRAFQEGQGLIADGIVGPNTRKVIGRVNSVLPAAPVLDDSGRIMRPGARGQDVAMLQQLLKVAGHSPGAVDGAYGPKTAAAVSSFQAASNLTVDGKVGPNTRDALSRLLGLAGLEFCS